MGTVNARAVLLFPEPTARARLPLVPGSQTSCDRAQGQLAHGRPRSLRDEGSTSTLLPMAQVSSVHSGNRHAASCPASEDSALQDGAVPPGRKAGQLLGVFHPFYGGMPVGPFRERKKRGRRKVRSKS